MISITIPGQPIAKKRPRFSRRGDYINAYDPQSNEKESVCTLLQSKMNRDPYRNALTLYIVFKLPIPKSTSKKDREQMKQKYLLPTKRPDLDNYIKFYLDCMNGIMYLDDAQIVHMTALKEYSDTPQTEISIRSMED